MDNVVKTKFKEYFYDERGNCIEWISSEGSCGYSIHHWKGKYNKNDSLVSEWHDAQEFYDYQFPKFEPRNFIYNKALDSIGRVYSEEVYEKDSLLLTKYYEYY